MKILLVNDDGIRAKGLEVLARLASRLGEVWVVAPEEQCSAMSHRITVRGKMRVKQVPFPVEGIQAYSVGGTPADCVKVALNHLLPEKPDYVFSGINRGFNAGIDILYSGTIGAAMEGLVNGIDAIAFSCADTDQFGAAEEYFFPIVQKLMEERLPGNEIWNVNFPGCPSGQVKGILWERRPARQGFYRDHYIKEDQPDGSFLLENAEIPDETAPEGTDMRALMDGYISIGRIRNMILTDAPGTDGEG